MQADEIYYDMKKGETAGADVLQEVFGTSVPEEVAKIMIEKGEIQFTQRYRQQLFEAKKKQIVTAIHRCAVDPKTGIPHPIARIENAMEEAKIKIDYTKSVEKQVKEIIPLLQPIIPISVEEFTFSVHVPTNFVSTVLKLLKTNAKLLKENWGADGSGFFVYKVPSGQSQDLIEKLNSMTHGSITLEKMSNDRY
jgi:ribosome maturation protein SDO1